MVVLKYCRATLWGNGLLILNDIQREPLTETPYKLSALDGE